MLPGGTTASVNMLWRYSDFLGEVSSDDWDGRSIYESMETHPVVDPVLDVLAICALPSQFTHSSVSTDPGDPWEIPGLMKDAFCVSRPHEYY